ncbi:MAG: ATP phosphoribosyltransferase regulatory subunit, partial [Burkholderiaceae bacterium]|nr:ATP phosphoribosyltransferase regulatory subunit [Burkholderiaceae bacterium]
TPQTARIDAHILNRSGVVRLCYAGSVLHTRPAHPLATRQPIQAGAELYGHAGIAADAEVQQLAVASLRRAGVQRVVLDLGHTAIVRALLAEVPPAVAEQIVEALAAKDTPALGAAARSAPPATAAALEALTRLHGDVSVIAEARRLLPARPAIARALDDLTRLAQASDADEVGIDLADLHGYRYYTGVNFAAYEPRVAGALLRGGRYDDIGRAFGRARPATGFSVDLRDLARLYEPKAAPVPIVAPADDDPALAQTVAALRAAGAVVVRQLAADEPAPVPARRLRRIDGRWQVVDQD